MNGNFRSHFSNGNPVGMGMDVVQFGTGMGTAMGTGIGNQKPFPTDLYTVLLSCDELAKPQTTHAICRVIQTIILYV